MAGMNMQQMMKQARKMQEQLAPRRRTSSPRPSTPLPAAVWSR